MRSLVELAQDRRAAEEAAVPAGRARPGPKPRNQQSIAMDSAMAAEITAEAVRQDRSVSWILRQAWLIARDQIRATTGPLASSTSE